MATVVDEGGYLELTDGTNTMLVPYEELKVDEISNPTFKHYAGKNHMFYDLRKTWLVFKVKGIHFTSHTNFSSFQDYIKDWQAAGAFTLKVRRNSTPNYAEWDGDNTSYTVAVAKNGKKGSEHISPADGDIWKISMLVFEQAG